MFGFEIFTRRLPCGIIIAFMSNALNSRISRFSTGMTAFVGAGILVYAILSGNGGTADSQREWQNARDRAVEVGGETAQKSSYLDTLINRQSQQFIDQTVTGSIRHEAESADAQDASSESESAEAVSVLSLIRNNSELKPGVSSGTARVSVVIEAGDTLYNISQRHGISVDDLAKLNGLNEPYTIKIGQTLYLAR